jgi:hypothetical protein
MAVMSRGLMVNIEPNRKHALIVLRTISETTPQYLPALCPTECLPKNVLESLNIAANKKDWTSLVFESHPIKRESQDLQWVTHGLLSNRTCDDAMAQSIRSRLAAAVRGADTSRPKYGACPFPSLPEKSWSPPTHVSSTSNPIRCILAMCLELAKTFPGLFLLAQWRHGTHCW